jgi:ribonuclease HI
MRVLASTDGVVCTDGRAGWAFIAEWDGGRIERAGALVDATSHLAEWTAISCALAWAETFLEEGATPEIYTDSALVAKGMASRRPAMTGEAAALRASCRQALARLAMRGITGRVVRVRREENAAADALARAAALSV